MSTPKLIFLRFRDFVSSWFILLLLSFFSFGYSGVKVNLSVDLIPGKEQIEVLHIRLEGKGRYTLFCSPINNPGIEVSYALSDSIFEPLNFNTKIYEGVMPESGAGEVSIFLKFLAPFTLFPKEYIIELYFWTQGDVKLDFGTPQQLLASCDNRIELGDILLNYLLKDRIKAGEEIKVKGTLQITGGSLTKGRIKLRLPAEIIYQENSFRFNGINLSPTTKDNLLLFEIREIEPGIYNFEYTIFARPWVESKIIFIGMGMDGYMDQGYIEYPEVVRWLFLEADIFYERGTILGRVYDKNNKGIEGVSLFLEDGARSQTDKEGRYSFRYIKPGRHIVSFRNHYAVVDLPPGGIYLLDFEIEPSRIAPKREFLFLSLAEAGVSGIKNGAKLEKLPLDGKLTLYFVGEIEGGVVIEALVNTEGKDFSELRYLIQPEEKYKVFADRSSFQAGNSGKFYIMIKKGDEYFNAGMINLENRLLGDSRGMLGTEAKKRFGALNLIAQAGIPSYLSQEEEFSLSSSGPFHLLSSPVLLNSERVYLETRDILDQRTVLESRLLIRDKDYQIDYERGILWLADYLLEEITMNPRFIIVKYQCLGDYKNLKDVNLHLREEASLSNLSIGLNFNRAGSVSLPYHSIGIDQHLNYPNLNIFTQYYHRIEDVEDGNGYRIGLGLSLLRSQLNLRRDYLGRGIKIPYPGLVPSSYEENSVGGDFDLHLFGLYLAPNLRRFREEKVGEIRTGIGKEAEFGWRGPLYQQKVFFKIGNIRTDGEGYWQTTIGYQRRGFSIAPFYRWSETQRFCGGILDFGTPQTIRFSLEEEYGFNLYMRTSISLDKSHLYGRLFLKPKIVYERRMIDDRDYISTLLATSLILEPIALTTDFDYRKYLKMEEEASYVLYRLILWPFRDLSLFSQTNLLNREIRLFESGIAYRPLWLRSISLLAMGKYELKNPLAAVDLGIAPFKNLNLTLGNGFGKDFWFHQAKGEIRLLFGLGLCLDAGLTSQGKLAGAGLFYELSPLRLTIGYNYLHHEEIKEGLYARIMTMPIKHWSFGLEENALEILDRFIIEVPPLITIGERAKVKISAVDKDSRVIKDFIGSVELITKASKRRLTFKEKYRGSATILLTLTDNKELGPNYILIKDRRGRTSRAFFYLRRQDEVVTYPEASPFIPKPEIEEFFSHFKIDVPGRAVAGEPFTVEITAMSNKNRVLESYTEEVEILTSNRERVVPNRFLFKPEDRGSLRVKLTYPNAERIRLLIRPVAEPLKVSISDYILFTKKGVVPPKPRPPEKPKPEVKKATPEEIDALFKQGMKYFTQGDYKEAEKIWKKILALDPQNAKAKRYLKETQLRLKGG